MMGEIYSIYTLPAWHFCLGHTGLLILLRTSMLVKAACQHT